MLPSTPKNRAGRSRKYPTNPKEDSSPSGGSSSRRVSPSVMSPPALGPVVGAQIDRRACDWPTAPNTPAPKPAERLGWLPSSDSQLKSARQQPRLGKAIGRFLSFGQRREYRRVFGRFWLAQRAVT